MLKPSAFLHQLGIKRNFNEAKYHALLKKHGYGTHTGGPAAQSTNDIFFADDEIAHQVLAQDFDRILDILKSFTTLDGFPKQPGAICELGAGAAIIAIWLAHLYPSARVVAVDHSANAIRFAEILARKANISTIEFLHGDFSAVKSRLPAHSFDLVFGAHVIFVDDGAVDYSRDHCEIAATAATHMPGLISSLVGAAAHLLSTNGVFLVRDANLSDLALLALFHASRKESLEVDWGCTMAKAEGHGDNRHLSEINVFLCPATGVPLIPPEDEHVALLMAGDLHQTQISLTPTNFHAYTQLILGHKHLREIRVEWPDGRKAWFCLAIRSGTLGVFIKSSHPFSCSGFVHSVASIWEATDHLLSSVDQALASHAQITFDYTDPGFAQAFTRRMSSSSQAAHQSGSANP